MQYAVFESFSFFLSLTHAIVPNRLNFSSSILSIGNLHVNRSQAKREKVWVLRGKGGRLVVITFFMGIDAASICLTYPARILYPHRTSRSISMYLAATPLQAGPWPSPPVTLFLRPLYVIGRASRHSSHVNCPRIREKARSPDFIFAYYLFS